MSAIKGSVEKLRKAGRKAALHHVSFRWPQPLLDRLHEHAVRESEKTGYVVSRSAFLLRLITEALDRRENELVDRREAEA